MSIYLVVIAIRRRKRMEEVVIESQRDREMAAGKYGRGKKVSERPNCRPRKMNKGSAREVVKLSFLSIP